MPLAIRLLFLALSLTCSAVPDSFSFLPAQKEGELITTLNLGATGLEAVKKTPHRHLK